MSKNNAKANTVFLDINEGDIKTKQDVIDFFEEKNFKRVNATFLYDFFDEFENSNQPVYWVGEFNSSPETHWVRFGKGRYMSKANPIIFWRLTKIKNGDTYFCTASRDQIDTMKLDTWTEFKDFVNKIFDN